MAHRSINTLVFAGFDPTTAATVISLMGDDGLPGDLRIAAGLNQEPWQTARTGLLIIGMDPKTDLVRVSQLIQNRTTYWDVAVCIPAVLSYYSVALLAQGAAKVLTHPEEDLEATKKELRSLLRTLSSIQSDAFGLEVSDLIQLYGEKRIPKTIRLTGNGCVGSIYLHNGSVVHSETMDDEEGMDAFRRLISLTSPEIRVHKGCLTDKKTIGIPAMSALLEGSRQVDEIQQRESRIDNDSESMDDEMEYGSMDAVPKIYTTPLPISERPVAPPPMTEPPRRSTPLPPPQTNKVDPLRNLFSDEDLDIH
jgi:hypothetical protein